MAVAVVDFDDYCQLVAETAVDFVTEVAAVDFEAGLLAVVVFFQLDHPPRLTLTHWGDCCTKLKISCSPIYWRVRPPRDVLRIESVHDFSLGCHHFIQLSREFVN